MTPPVLIARDILRERYLDILLVKLKAGPEIDHRLCDRIERLLADEPAPAPSKTASRRIEIADVIGVVSRRFGVEPEQLVGPSRAQPECGARQLAMRLSRELTGKSYPEIGRAFHRDHATVMHACEVTEGMAVGDIREELEEMLRG